MEGNMETWSEQASKQSDVYQRYPQFDFRFPLSSGFLGFETSRLEAQLLRSLSSVMGQSHMSSMAWLCVRVWILDADNQRTGPRGLACFVSATGHPRGTVTAGGLDSAGSDSGGT